MQTLSEYRDPTYSLERTSVSFFTQITGKCSPRIPTLASHSLRYSLRVAIVPITMLAFT